MYAMRRRYSGQQLVSYGVFGVTGTQAGFDGRQLTMGTFVRGSALADERRRLGYRRLLIL
jgi:hypothetical protein